MSTPIEVCERLNILGPQAIAALLSITSDLAARRPPYGDDELTVGSFPAGGGIAVPIAVTVLPKPDRYECEVVIEAKTAPHLFPRFTGMLSISPLRATGSEVWLQGSYDVPLGGLGAMADATVLHGAAHSSLEHFVTWMGAEIRRRVASESAPDLSRR